MMEALKVIKAEVNTSYLAKSYVLANFQRITRVLGSSF